MILNSLAKLGYFCEKSVSNTAGEQLINYLFEQNWAHSLNNYTTSWWQYHMKNYILYILYVAWYFDTAKNIMKGSHGIENWEKVGNIKK